MTIPIKKLPGKYPTKLQRLIDQEYETVERMMQGKGIEDEEKDFFGYSKDLFAFEIVRANNIDASGFARASEVHALLMKMFRDVLEEIETNSLLECMTLCVYGYVLNNYIDEDVRYLYRYSLNQVRDHGELERWLRRAITFISSIEEQSPKDILNRIRHWLGFFGAPLHNPKGFTEFSQELGIDLDPILEEENFKLVDTLRRHSQYLNEAVIGRNYDDIWNATKDWLPDVLSSEILSIFRKQVYQESQNKIDSDSTVEESYKSVKKIFERVGFRSQDRTTLPVRLQELESPPIGEAIDPVVFEMIPQKLRRDLLPAVAYYRPTKTIEIHFLGGRIIGRSGILIKTDTGGILLDYGLSVANQRIPEWIPELEMIDTVLISHSHLDHIGGLPVLYEKYEGKWCSTSATGVITKALLDDAIKIGTPALPRRRDRTDLISRFKQDNIDKVAKNHVRLEIGKSSEVGPGIVVTPIDAAHIPGSVSYLIDIEGKRILYTGDFNLDKSVLFPGATLPTDSDVVIFDGTYWDRADFDRTKVYQQISSVIEKHGPVIIPSFAVGRSQEILVMLDELGITRNRNVMVAGMAEQVTKLVGISGNWQGMKKNKVVLDKQDVLVAGGGMLGGGLARHHFKEQRANPKAAIIPCGYLAPRTPGWNLVNGYEPHDCTVSYARLSAHSSSGNLQEYIRSCKGKKVIVHTPLTQAPKGVIMPGFAERLIIPVK